MLSEKTEKQNFAVRILTAHLENKRVAHTYLLTGEKESGKDEVALAFAAALNCLESKYFKSCTCASCHKIEIAHHPDIHAVGADKKVKSIKIEEVRGVLEAAGFKPYEGKYKVFIIHDAHRLTVEASNALLKTLEEPPAHTVFILIAQSKEHLMETIQSRSFEIRLRPLGDEPIVIPGEMAEGGQGWEDVLEDYATASRDEIKTFFDELMNRFRYQIKSGKEAPVFLHAIDSVIQCKEAIDANSNQKLVLSRLAMQLKKMKVTASV